LDEKGGGLHAEGHRPNREVWGWQHHDVGVLCCRRDCCTLQHVGILRKGNCVYIEATSQDISQEVKAWLQMGLPNGQ
jgi:hypothetical protein